MRLRPDRSASESHEPARRAAAVEAMEGRVLLSGSVAGHRRVHLPTRFARVKLSPVAAVVGGPWASPAIQPFAGPTPPYTPAQVRHFYGLDALAAAGNGDGAGQTIALVDAFQTPNIVSDLAAFDSAFGLPAPPSFAVVGELGGSVPSTADAGWGLETSLDVEWAHAVAPAAKLLLVECNSASTGDLFAGAGYAATVAGVSVVSMSFGATEGTTSTTFSAAGEAASDGYFTTPSGHAGVTFVAATGDAGAAATTYPALSPNVLAVGGTSITLADATGTYGSESAWNNGGGTVSAYERPPAYQTAAGLGYAGRAAPDVSFEADPNTGVFLYDSSNSTAGNYYVAGGTSLAAPCWAGLVAVADQQRVAAGLSTYDGATQTLPRLYSIYKSASYSTDFHDVTAGSNGNPAGTGYDLATGLGTPVANLLVPDLADVATTGTVTGRVFQDDNADGALDGADVPLPGTVLYLDANNDGVHEAAEPTATADSTGTYTFPAVAAGSTGTVRVLSTPLTGGVPVAPPAYAVTAAGVATANVGLFPTVYADATAGDAWTLRASPASPATLQVLVNGTVAYSAPTTLPTTLSFGFTGTADGLTVDFGTGVPVPSGGVALNAGSAATGDALSVLGTAGADTITVDKSDVIFGSAGPITFANVPTVSVDPRGGSDSLTVTGGTATLLPQAAGGGILDRAFSQVAISAGATLRVSTAAAHADRTVLDVAAGGLSDAGTLDLGGNDLIVRSGSVTAETALAAAGYAAGTWAGTGLASSVAAADPTRRTALGVAAATATSFDGLTVAAADVLVKYTYYGDADLSGRVSGSDYARIDAGFAAALTGWAAGDFDYDGRVDGSDYTLVDDVFNTQTATL